MDFLVYFNSRLYQNILGSDGSLDWILTSFNSTKITISMLFIRYNIIPPQKFPRFFLLIQKHPNYSNVVYSIT